MQQPTESLEEEILRRAQRQQKRDAESRPKLRVVGNERGHELVHFGDAVDPWENDERRFTIGIENFDKSLKARRAGDFMVVGALPGGGKTSLLEMAAVTNARAGYKVLVVSLEMLEAELQGKMIARKLGVSAENYDRQRKENTAAYVRARADLSKLPLKFYRPPAGQEASIEQIFERAESWGADMIAVDYAAKIGGWEPGNVARSIVSFASARVKHTGIFLFMLAQLDQKVLLRNDKRPTMADFEDSKALAKEATSVVLIHRPFIGQASLDNVAELCCVKNRKFAPTFKCHVHWHGPTTTFFTMNDEEENNALCCKSMERKRGPSYDPTSPDDRAEEDALLEEGRRAWGYSS